MKGPTFLCLVLACAPSLPDNLPATSAASEKASEAPAANIGIALREDPPLPGEDAGGWAGLAAPESVSGAQHTHGMSGMDMKGMDMGGTAADAGQAPARERGTMIMPDGAVM